MSLLYVSASTRPSLGRLYTKEYIYSKFCRSCAASIINNHLWFVTSLLHLRQNLLYLYSFLYIHPNDGLVEAGTCRNYIINDNCLLFIIITIIIIIFLHGLGRLTCSGIDALPSFLGASTVSSSSRFVVESVFRESGVVHSFKVVDQVLSVFESHVLYSRDL